MTARHPDGWQPVALSFAGLECLIAALVITGRAVGRGRALRWLRLHHPAHLAGKASPPWPSMRVGRPHRQHLDLWRTRPNAGVGL
jgi:hypothetical protein